MSLPEAAVLDTSVLLRLFHDHKDHEQRAADRLLETWLAGEMTLVMLDLSIYEFVNVLVRRLKRGAAAVSRDVANLFALDLPIVAIDADLATETAKLAATNGLSGYDAAFVAAAKSIGIPLITADKGIASKAKSESVLALDELS